MTIVGGEGVSSSGGSGRPDNETDHEKSMQGGVSQRGSGGRQLCVC